MRLSLLISLSLLLLSWQTACAQLAPADDFFNSGAQCYISNNIPQARESVATGLKLYPDDIKLKKLDELLKQQSQQQQTTKPAESAEPTEPAIATESKATTAVQAKSVAAANQQQQQNHRRKTNRASRRTNNSRNSSRQNWRQQSHEKRAEQTGQAQEAKAQEMSPEQAQRLLDAQKGDEQFLQLKPKSPPESPNKPIKDW